MAKSIDQILDDAPAIGPYDFRWPCLDCGNPDTTYMSVRPLSSRHIWLCRECAKDDVRRGGIPVLRVIFEHEAVYEYIFRFLTWLEADPRRHVIVGGRRVFCAADLYEVMQNA